MLSQTSTGTVAKATLGKVLRDGKERIWVLFFLAHGDLLGVNLTDPCPFHSGVSVIQSVLSYSA